MRKSQSREGAVRDHSASERWTAGNVVRRKKDARVIPFPTEPSTIGDRKIDRAIERVISRKK
jgi:hypothetical protein